MESQKCNPCVGAKSALPSMGLQTTLFYAAQNMAEYGNFEEIRVFLFPRYRVCTKVIITSKESYVNGEPKNVIVMSVQKAHFQVRGCKLHGFMERRIG